MIRLRLLPLLGLCAMLGSPANGEPEYQFHQYINSKTPTSYCGLYCALAAAHCLGLSPPFEPMIDEQFLTGQYGSSNLDLIRLLGSIDLEGTFRSDLTLDDLRSLSTPVILHVRPPSAVAYSHWLMFSGFDSTGQVMAYDPPDGTGLLSPAELLAVWDGAGVIVTRRNGGNRPLVWPVSFTSLVAVIVTGVLVWALGTKARGVSLILAVSTLSSTFVHLSPTGFVRNVDSVNTVRAPYFRTPLREISSAALRSKVATDDVVLVDARSSEAFKSYHLPNAINIAVACGVVSLSKRIDMLREKSLNKTVVVYCRGPKCEWADRVASLIALRTGRQPLVYRDGVLGWAEHMKGD